MNLGEAQRYIETHPEPGRFESGGCIDCGGRPGPCDWHAAQGLIDDARKREIMRAAVAAVQRHRIARTCVRFEFESDEVYTREEKAKTYLKTGAILPRW